MRRSEADAVSEPVEEAVLEHLTGFLVELRFVTGAVKEVADLLVQLPCRMELHSEILRPGFRKYPRIVDRDLIRTGHRIGVLNPLDHMQRVTIPSGETLMIPFQWDSPFFSVSGGAGSPNDLDIYLFNAAGKASLY